MSDVKGCFTSIFSFGDSYTDTGNVVHISLSESRELPRSAFPPHGRTFFGHPTGRSSDGRLVIDFLAKDLGLPFVAPYFGGENGTSQNFQKGVNFAVSGATALDSAFLAERRVYGLVSNLSLGDEVGFFKDVLPSLCSSSSEYHNELLQKELDRIRKLHPNVHIIYADYYNTAMRFYTSPNKFGFTETLKSCCGVGEAAYRLLSKAILEQLFTIPSVNNLSSIYLLTDKLISS
ncbi:hypothetical protein QQP08_022089 [Theobroma cacao]|nr:hypothetical protein QQP08_022089 [Theobroma cacao]